MITEWKQLEGRTVTKVQEFSLGGYVIFFEDGEFALIDGSGEERHGGHWPILVEPDPRIIAHILAVKDKPCAY